MPYIDTIQPKSETIAYDMHDKRLSPSIGQIDSIVQQSRKVAGKDLSSDVTVGDIVSACFTVTDVVID